jgi:hypothetical protein
MNIHCTSRDIILASMVNVINHFPCNTVNLHDKIQDLKTMDKNNFFDLKPNFTNDKDDIAVFELIIVGLDTGLDIEKYFPLRSNDNNTNIHFCSVFFTQDIQIDRIVFTLISISRDVTFEVEFDKYFQFKSYDMHYLSPEKMLGSSDDSIAKLIDEMSHLAC